MAVSAQQIHLCGHACSGACFILLALVSHAVSRGSSEVADSGRCIPYYGVSFVTNHLLQTVFCQHWQSISTPSLLTHSFEHTPKVLGLRSAKCCCSCHDKLATRYLLSYFTLPNILQATNLGMVCNLQVFTPCFQLLMQQLHRFCLFWTKLSALLCLAN